MIEFNRIVFFTYSLYVKETGSKSYDSVCDRTTIGWYRGPDPKVHTEWGCFFGEKAQLSLSESSAKVNPDEAVKWVQPEFMSFLQKPSVYEDYVGFVEAINR